MESAPLVAAEPARGGEGAPPSDANRDLAGASEADASLYVREDPARTAEIEERDPAREFLRVPHALDRPRSVEVGAPSQRNDAERSEGNPSGDERLEVVEERPVLGESDGGSRRLSALDLENFGPVLEGREFAFELVAGQRPSIADSGAGSMHDQILPVDVVRGRTPRHSSIVPEDHAVETHEGEASHVLAGELDLRPPDHGRVHVRQMGIVREDRLPRNRVGARDGPAVARAPASAQQVHQRRDVRGRKGAPPRGCVPVPHGVTVRRSFDAETG